MCLDIKGDFIMLHYADFRVDKSGDILIVSDYFPYNSKHPVEVTLRGRVLRCEQRSTAFMRLEIPNSELLDHIKRAKNISMCFLDLYGGLQQVEHLIFKEIKG